MDGLIHTIGQMKTTRTFGRVVSVQGLLVEIVGPVHAMSIGARLAIRSTGDQIIQVEVVGFEGDKALCLAFAPLEGVRRGCEAYLEADAATVSPSDLWRGRVLNAMGEPIDGKGPLLNGAEAYPLRAQPPTAHSRGRVGGTLDLGVRALNTFVTCSIGQRMGIFAGSGVGKSVLMSILARHALADTIVIGLIGERGREVQEFIEDDLGEEGLKRSVVIVATSDETPLMRRQAAYLTLAVSEYFRDQKLNVLCMMDSVTRFAQAQREIGLAAGEPPTTRGYTPTVFSELPRLLERAGPGPKESGSITGLFTVLVEGDDHNEPVADAVRGILDGHIVMERRIAERGRYPAINVLKSVSRTLPGSADPDFWPVVQEAKRLMSAYADMEELIRLGAYRKGSDATVDRALELNDAFETYLRQSKSEAAASLEDGYRLLQEILEDGV
ncbi:flagellar protein export ATPase FliI [Coralliovum pocilloporae]|uniref:flagellar protein export ATPase FliI n=1 Tax=Coralliovum pocilloporae TaxID=3066369 RepID=UPI00330743B4